MTQFKVLIAKKHRQVKKACTDVLIHNLHFNGESMIKYWCQYFLVLNKYNQIHVVNQIYTWTRRGLSYQRPEFIIAILKLNGKIIGCIIVQRTHCRHNSFTRWYSQSLTGFYIKPEYRRQGLMSRAWLQLKEEYPLDYKVINSGHTKAAIAFKRKHNL